MEKILVTTDISPNSKAGMRYAIHMAAERGAQLHFLYVDHVLRGALWSDERYKEMVRQSKVGIMREFPAFVKGVYDSMKMTPGDHLIVVHPNMFTTDGIVEYSEAQKVDYICISTRGAGTLKKIFGTHTCQLIVRSKIPVLCIPSTYRYKAVEHVLYATDMRDYADELKKVVAFARPVHASVEMLHLAYSFEPILDKEMMEKTMEKDVNYKISLHYQSRDVEKSILEDIETAIKKIHPSLLILFTDQSRSFFESIIIPGNAKEFAFQATLPLLSFSQGTVG